MKKITTVFCITVISVLLILTTGCGNSDSGRKEGEIYGRCYPNNTCNDGLVCDTESNTCIKDDTVDEDAEIPDNEDFDDTNNTEADDDTESETISDEDSDSDEKNDTDPSKNEDENWKDPKTGLIWSEKHSIPGPATLDDLVSFCDNLVEGGFGDWKMPTIDELRTLIQNCPDTEPYGFCKISEEAGTLSWYDDLDMWRCDCSWKAEWTQQIGKDEFIDDNGGYYSKIGDDQNVALCSSSRSDYGGDLWLVSFGSASIGITSLKDGATIRCVGSYSRQKQCEGLPDGASWNVFSSIPQMWDGSSWQPADAASYNEKPSDTECRFICNPGYKWDGSKCALQDLKAISECSHGSPTPCYDSSSGLVWSAKAPYEMLHYDAVDYCDNLVEGGYSDWHLPTISELRTLIQNCRWTVTGGDCRITDDCLSSTACEYSYSQCDNDCNGIGGNGGIYVIYSKFGDEGDFLSSSKLTDYPDDVWGVNFDKAQILSFGTDEVYSKGSVRCVKKVNVPCTGLPENAVWNSVSSILQTCDETSCQPSTAGVYNETPSKTECRFKCYPGYKWNDSKCTLKNPEALSECGPESPMPCRDSATGLIWSDKPSEMMMLDDAQNYCDNLVEGVIDDWRLPTIGELRTLIVNCPATEPGGVCGVTDECLLIDNCWARTDCKCRYGEAAYSKFHSKFMYELISSASKTGKIISGFENVWCIDFSEAGIKSCSLEYGQTFRCVR
jgi:Nucleosome binding factor SPN, SPT16 subunit